MSLQDIAAFDLAPIVALLSGTGAFKRVEGVLELAAVNKDAGLALPAAFVFVEAETASAEQSGAGFFEQIVASTIGVAMVVTGEAARRGSIDATLSKLETAVHRALFAAKLPEPVVRPLAYAGGQLLGFAEGRAAHLVRYRAVRRFRRTRNPA